MKNEIKTYMAPAVEEHELTVESGIANSVGSTVTEYSEVDLSGDGSFWQ